MPITFHLFGLAHWAVLAAIPLLAGLLALLQRKLVRGTRLIRWLLAGLLVFSAASYYGHFAWEGEALFPGHVPLELCDLSLILTIVVLLRFRPALFDVVYYWALAGATMALLTPNIGEQTTLFLAVVFFADHGLTVTAVLYLVWSRQARPRAGSVWRALLAVNVAAVVVGAFDFAYKTDYMFLRQKPATASLLDMFGPWPWYIAACEGAGLMLFALLYWPFRRSRRVSEEEPAEATSVR
jgi:hypothetical integral membrane protein (TIGR02206 family)